MKHRWVRSIAFFILLYLLCSYFAKVATAAGTDSVGNYSAGLTVAGLYAEPENSLDVLIFGSSTLRAAFLPKVIWDTQGIASYNLGSPSQDAAISYYLLRGRAQNPDSKCSGAQCVTVVYGARNGKSECGFCVDRGRHENRLRKMRYAV